MKRHLFFILAIWISFSACKKDNDITDNQEPTIELNGVIYTVDYVKRGLSRLLNIPLDELIFNEQDGVFNHTYFYMELDPSLYIENIERIRKGGYDF